MKSEQETFSSKFGCFCPFWHGAGKSHICAEERSGAAPSSPNSNLIAHPTQVDGTAAGAPPRRSEIASTRGASGRGELLRTPGREEVKRPCDAQIAREGLASALKAAIQQARTPHARVRADWALWGAKAAATRHVGGCRAGTPKGGSTVPSAQLDRSSP